MCRSWLAWFVNFSSKCPILEQVMLHGSSKLVNLGVESSTLKYLSIKYCIQIKSIWRCNSKNLVPFHCCSHKRRIRLLLAKVPRLVEVYVSLYSWDVDYFGFPFATLSCCLQRLVLEMCILYTYWFSFFFSLFKTLGLTGLQRHCVECVCSHICFSFLFFLILVDLFHIC